LIIQVKWTLLIQIQQQLVECAIGIGKCFCCMVCHTTLIQRRGVWHLSIDNVSLISKLWKYSILLYTVSQDIIASLPNTIDMTYAHPYLSQISGLLHMTTENFTQYTVYLIHTIVWIKYCILCKFYHIIW
jgi:hypothetical protein